ncbi:MAG: hypothetical protein IJ855_04395 [Bacteroidales bacterium]|nr:hypothetical protein [Bacteroidales bacterium]
MENKLVERYMRDLAGKIRETAEEMPEGIPPFMDSPEFRQILMMEKEFTLAVADRLLAYVDCGSGDPEDPYSYD